MKSLVRSLLGILIFLILWEAVALALDKSIIVPTPGQAIQLLLQILPQTTTLVSSLQTAWKVLLALLLVLFLGLPAGLLLGLVQALYDMSRPIILVIQAVPVISWLSLVLFTWGRSWQGPVLIAFISLLPVAILTTVSGVRNLDRKLLEMARLYKVPALQVLKEIYLGSLLPFIVAIVDVSLGQAWKVILVAEYLCGDGGLGLKIFDARSFVDTPAVYAFTLLAVMLGIATERLIKLGTGRVSKRWIPVS
ncbi:MAG: ABC transporter permease subunit [Syntrophomonas sp.]